MNAPRTEDHTDAALWAATVTLAELGETLRSELRAIRRTLTTITSELTAWRHEREHTAQLGPAHLTLISK